MWSWNRIWRIGVCLWALLGEPHLQAEQSARVVRLLITSDIHGWLSSRFFYPTRRPFGLLHLAGHIKRLKAQHPQSLLLDAGDLISGSPDSLYALTHGSAPEQNPFLDLVFDLSYDAIAIGNHDLEHYPKLAQLSRHEQKTLPWIAANVVHNNQQPRLPLKPYRIFHRKGVKIAVLGLTTPGVHLWVDPAVLSGLQVTDLVQSAAYWVAHIQEQEEPDLLIGLVHSGLNQYRSNYESDIKAIARANAVYEMLRKLRGFDLVIAGHDHRLQPRNSTDPLRYVDATPVLQPGKWGQVLMSFTMRWNVRLQRWQIYDNQELGGRVSVLRPVPKPTAQLHSAYPFDPAFLEYMNTPAPDWRLRRITAHAQDQMSIESCLNATYLQAIRGGKAAGVLLPPLRLKPRYLKEGHTILRRHLFHWLPYDNHAVRIALNSVDLQKISDIASGALWNDLHKKIIFDFSELEKVHPPVQMSPKAPTPRAFARYGKLFSRYKRHFPVITSNYLANGGAGLLPRFLVPTDTLAITEKQSKSTSDTLRHIFFEHLKRQRPDPTHCPMFGK